MHFPSRMISVLAPLLAMLALAGVSWSVWNRHFVDRPESKQQQRATSQAKIAAQINIDKIIESHIFGQKPKAVKPRVVEAPPTRLKLKLVGILRADESSQTRALIETPNNKQQVVALQQAIGDTGVTLHSVEKDHVLIEHAGKLEKLAMLRPIIKEMIQ